ncbi:MAG: hypothetical protein HGA49_02135 [Eubacteriaceae bacterium]|nr:hypothetical protein [Eubacteriaceae bacterium]
MAVKAKEINKRNPVTYKQMLLLFGVLIAFDVIYRMGYTKLSEAAQIFVSVFSIALSLTFMFFSLKKIIPRYEMMVADNSFVIYKTMFFKPKMIAAVPLEKITDVSQKYEKTSWEGRKSDYTLYGIKDKITYVVEYKAGDNKANLIIQATKKFTDKLEKSVVKKSGNESR